MYEENSLVGKILNDRYEILEVVGSGGMATVYKAECKLLNRYVAVKVLKDSFRYDLDLKEKFNKEAQAAARLSHNNIVSIFDVGEIEGLNYIVMELIEGITLKEYISQNKPINWMIARNIAIQIGLALEHAHANGIIHRDIKPHNILITKDNIIKVADFGIASAVSSETFVAGKSESPMGSVHYISPEQARGGFVNETSDIYSLGVIMYEMITGQLPFDGDNPVSIAMMKIEQEPLNCKVINLDIPHDMAEIVMRAIARESASRFQTVQEMLIALKRLGRQTNRQTVSRIREEKTVQVDNNVSRKEKNNEEKKSGFNKIILGAIFSLLGVILLAGIGSFAYCNSCGTKDVKVPEIIGLTLEEAKLTAEREGFKISESFEFDNDVEEGKIISQDPGANIYVKANNKTIIVVVSKGKDEGESVELIDVTGMKYEDAVKKLREIGLKSEKIEVENNDEEEGTVIEQSPPKGESVSKGSTVKLSVCKHYEERTLVPNVKGMTKKNAEIVLKNAGFKLGNVREETSDKPAGEVIEQNPTAGSESPKGTNINIVVSRGKSSDTGENGSENSDDNSQGSNSGNGGGTQGGSAPEEEIVPQEKTLTIPFPEGDKEKIKVRVVANGNEIYNAVHNRSEQKVDIRVKAKRDVVVKLYFDDEFYGEKIVEFN